MAALFTFPPQKTRNLYVPNDEPVYRVVGRGFWDGETLHQEYDEQGKVTLLAWPEEPNFNLLPMNELALAEVEKWLNKLDSGAATAKASSDDAVRRLVGLHEIEARTYRTKIADSGRFSSERVNPPVLSTNAVKSKARRIEQPEVEAPEIKRAKKADQDRVLNG
jgi:hypothetical protein